MKKILSVLLIISVMLTFSISTAFADVPDYKSAEVKTAVETAIAAVNNSDYTKSTAETIESYKTELRNTTKNKTSYDYDVLTAINTFNKKVSEKSTFVEDKQELELFKIAVLKQFDANYSTAVTTYLDTLTTTEAKNDFTAKSKIVKEWYEKSINRVSLSDGYTEGVAECKLAEAKNAIEAIYNISADSTVHIADIKTFSARLMKLPALNIDAKAFFDKKALQTTQYSKTACEQAYNQTVENLYYDYVREAKQPVKEYYYAEIKTLAQEKVEATEAAKKALLEAKSAAKIAITTGQYDVKNYSGDAAKEIAKIQSQYTAYIGYAATIEKVESEKAEAIAKMSVYKTDAQIKEEANAELDKLKQEKALNDAIDSISLTARSSKTSKGNIKVTVKGDISAITDLGYTVEYKFYRATGPRFSKYYEKIQKSASTYTNTKGVKGKTYRYKVSLVIYDKDGNLVKETNKNLCKYAQRVFG